jgi:hypothetical protein
VALCEKHPRSGSKRSSLLLKRAGHDGQVLLAEPLINGMQAQQTLGESVPLTTNFRSVRPILDWVNAVYSRVTQPQHNAQPQYRLWTRAK